MSLQKETSLGRSQERSHWENCLGGETALMLWKQYWRLGIVRCRTGKELFVAGEPELDHDYGWCGSRPRTVGSWAGVRYQSSQEQPGRRGSGCQRWCHPGRRRRRCSLRLTWRRPRRGREIQVVQSLSIPCKAKQSVILYIIWYDSNPILFNYDNWSLGDLFNSLVSVGIQKFEEVLIMI